jgi:hypothetical protein
VKIPCKRGCGIDAWSTVEAEQHDAICERNPVAERRQRAREAFEDAMSAPSPSHAGPLLIRAKVRQDRARDEAIETATRVQVTDEIERAAELAAGDTIHDYDGAEMRRVLIAAFRAAGFEVEG